MSRNQPREQSLTRVDHPDFLFGRSLVPVNLHELADRIQNGSPAEGWEGDPRLALTRYRDPESREEWFELYRLELDGEYRLVARLRGHLDPSNIIAKLVEMDARRGYDIKDAVDRHNAKLEKSREAAAAEKHEAAADRLAFGLMKDLGHFYTGMSKRVL